MKSDVLSVKGVKAITYITTCPDKQVVLSLLCSQLNTVSFKGLQCLRALINIRHSNIIRLAGVSHMIM